MTAFDPPVRLRLDGEALVANWQALSRLSDSAATGAAVKANGYGLGAREVVSRLSKAGCRDFFVAHWGEAEAIADLIPPEQIAVLNGVCDNDVHSAINLGAIPVLNTPQQISAWKALGGGKCHVMLDTGMNRLGIGSEQRDGILFDGLDIDILLSHLASADDDSPQNAKQLANFMAMSAGIKARRRSLSNSAGILLGDKYHFDLTRPGLALYGGVARAEMAKHLNQVAYPQAKVLQIRSLQAGDTVGYNATFRCPYDMRVATVAIGYADGYRRAFSNIGSYSVEDSILPVIGRISMDLVTLNITNAPDLREGDWVSAEYNLQTISELSGQSQYELLTGLGSRFARHWV